MGEFAMNCRPATNIEEIIGKTLQMEVLDDAILKVRVIEPALIQYQYIDLNDEIDDPVFTALLSIEYDDIDGVWDWSFGNGLGGRYFLHMFDTVD